MASIPMLAVFTVPKLKERCRELGIPVGGKKADLVARIQGKLSEVGAVTVTTPPVSSSSSGGAHILFNSTTQRTGKRKAATKNPSQTPSEQDLGTKKAKTFRATDVTASTLASTQLPLLGEAAVCDPSSDLSNIKPRGDGYTPKVAKQPAPKTPGEVFDSSRVIRQDQQPADTDSDQVLPPVPRPFATTFDPADGSLSSTVNLSTKISSITQGISFGKQKGLIPAKQRKDGNATVPDTTAGRKSLVKKIGLAKPDKPRFGGLDVYSSVQVGVTNMSSDDFGTMAGGDSLTLSGERELPASEIITTAISEDSNLNPALPLAPYPRDLVTVKSTRRFRGLEPINKNIASTDTTKSLPQVNSQLPPPRKQDHEVSASIIRNPPRYSFRRQVERIAQVLALVAFHGFFPHTSSSASGDFLKRFAGLSRNYRYASTLAFTHLIRIEFSGNRTENWLKTKRVDEKVGDLRAWYWYRFSERKRVIEWLRTSWMERVWRFLLASVTIGSIPEAPGRLGLWFCGINQYLLADPDVEGQFETAIRFWIRRFYVWVTKNGGGYPLLLQDLQDEMVQKIQPVDEKGNRELWKVETRCGGVHFILGMTGEVVGWVEMDGVVGNGLELVSLRRAKTRMGTIIRKRTGVGATGSGAGSLHGNLRKQVNTDNITWQSLREDWRKHTSALVLSSSTTNGADVSPRTLLQSVYRPSSKTVSHGIHESVKLPHHRALAERWILAQVEPGGISGKPVLEALHDQAHRREKVVLDLQAKLMVESVRCAGEKWTSSMGGVLAQGLGFVQTPAMGWFVLEETGQNIAQEEYGIQGLWATVLGVDEKGVILNLRDLEKLREMFVWKGMLD